MVTKNKCFHCLKKEVLSCLEKTAPLKPKKKQTNGLSLIEKKSNLENIPDLLYQVQQQHFFRMASYSELYVLYFIKIIICHVFHG